MIKNIIDSLLTTITQVPVTDLPQILNSELERTTGMLLAWF